MSRWGDAFARLSRGHDTVDTLRHNEGSPFKVSQSVDSVTPSPSGEVVVGTRAGEGGECSPHVSASNRGEIEEERAAIVKHDGGIPRVWAEGFSRLDPERPPGDVPPRCWQRFINDVGRFLDSPFCSIAAALGWDPVDLFGCDRDRPYARIDRAGLLWPLGAGRIVALTANTATIEFPTGSRQIWRQRAHERGQVLPWELVS